MATSLLGADPHLAHEIQQLHCPHTAINSIYLHCLDQIHKCHQIDGQWSLRDCLQEPPVVVYGADDLIKDSVIQCSGQVDLGQESVSMQDESIVPPSHNEAGGSDELSRDMLCILLY